MDQQRRLLTFTVLSFVILFGWMSLGPKLFPGFFPKPVPKQAQKKDPKKVVAEKTEIGPNDAEKPEATAAEFKLPEHPTLKVVIGSDDPNTGYGLRVTLSSVGAGIVSAELNDQRYKALKPPMPKIPVLQLSLLGNNLDKPLKPLDSEPAVTGHLAIGDIDQRLEKIDPNATLKSLNWEVVETTDDPAATGVKSAVTFGLKTPDGVWEIRKKYEARRWADTNVSRDADPTGYQLAMHLQFKNLSTKDETLVYDLQGPVGVPLENKEHTSKFRDVKFGFREPDGDLVTNALTIGELIKAHDKNQIEDLKAGNRTFQYVGLDTQYFTALVMPQDAAAKQSTYLDLAKPEIITRNKEQTNWSEVGIRLRSVETKVPPESEFQHDFHLYLGPKRVALLRPLGADKIIDYSGFLVIIPASLVALIGNSLLWVLNSLHGVGIPYGICIMMLTVLVRSCMFPISRKQASNAKKMKELQPKLAELKAKHGDDKQKMAQGQMDLFAEHGFNPFGGCLPLLLQLPIFIGLYQSLSTSVDLRRAPFLWFDNLAAPDSLFMLPWKLPVLGNEFNLLPLITTSLFLLQQKMFMPPPTDEQTRMQAKMFFWMTLFMGFMFYHVPAGLCVYFIASSLWSMGERKLLDYGTGPSSAGDPAKLPPLPPKSDPGNGSSKPDQGFWGRLTAKLEEMGEMKDINGVPVSGQRRDKADKDKKKQRW